jgi:hypothetical protein
MIRPATLCLAIAATLLLGACASTRTTPVITAFTDPDFTGHRYRRLVVAADVSDLAGRSSIETALVEELLEHGIAAERSLAIFPPTRQWSEQQRVEELQRRGIDGLLKVTLVKTWTTQDHIPQTSTTKVTRETKEKEKPRTGEEGKETKGTEEETITTTTQGGYDVTYDWSRHQAELIDIASGRVAWVGVGEAESGHYNVSRFRDNIVEQLVFDKLLTAIK